MEIQGRKCFQMDKEASVGFNLMEVSDKSHWYWRKLKYEYNTGKLKFSYGQHCWSSTVKGNGAVTEGDQRRFWVWVGNRGREGSTFVFQVEMQVPEHVSQVGCWGWSSRGRKIPSGYGTLLSCCLVHRHENLSTLPLPFSPFGGGKGYVFIGEKHVRVRVGGTQNFKCSHCMKTCLCCLDLHRTSEPTWWSCLLPFFVSLPP